MGNTLTVWWLSGGRPRDGIPSPMAGSCIPSSATAENMWKQSIPCSGSGSALVSIIEVLSAVIMLPNGAVSVNIPVKPESPPIARAESSTLTIGAMPAGLFPRSRRTDERGVATAELVVNYSGFGLAGGWLGSGLILAFMVKRT